MSCGWWRCTFHLSCLAEHLHVRQEARSRLPAHRSGPSLKYPAPHLFRRASSRTRSCGLEEAQEQPGQLVSTVVPLDRCCFQRYYAPLQLSSTRLQLSWLSFLGMERCMREKPFSLLSLSMHLVLSHLCRSLSRMLGRRVQSIRQPSRKNVLH